MRALYSTLIVAGLAFAPLPAFAMGGSSDAPPTASKAADPAFATGKAAIDK